MISLLISALLSGIAWVLRPLFHLLWRLARALHPDNLLWTTLRVLSALFFGILASAFGMERLLLFHLDLTRARADWNTKEELWTSKCGDTLSSEALRDLGSMSSKALQDHVMECRAAEERLSGSPPLLQALSMSLTRFCATASCSSWMDLRAFLNSPIASSALMVAAATLIMSLTSLLALFLKHLYQGQGRRGLKEQKRRRGRRNHLYRDDLADAVEGGAERKELEDHQERLLHRALLRRGRSLWKRRTAALRHPGRKYKWESVDSPQSLLSDHRIPSGSPDRHPPEVD